MMMTALATILGCRRADRDEAWAANSSRFKAIRCGRRWGKTELGGDCWVSGIAEEDGRYHSEHFDMRRADGRVAASTMTLTALRGGKIQMSQ